MSEDNKKVIRDFISYLNSDTVKCGSIEERRELQEKDIVDMSKLELRSHLFILFSGEIFYSGKAIRSMKEI